MFKECSFLVIMMVLTSIWQDRRMLKPDYLATTEQERYVIGAV